MKRVEMFRGGKDNWPEHFWHPMPDDERDEKAVDHSLKHLRRLCPSLIDNDEDSLWDFGALLAYLFEKWYRLPAIGAGLALVWVLIALVAKLGGAQ